MEVWGGGGVNGWLKLRDDGGMGLISTKFVGRYMSVNLHAWRGGLWETNEKRCAYAMLCRRMDSLRVVEQLFTSHVGL